MRCNSGTPDLLFVLIRNRSQARGATRLDLGCVITGLQPVGTRNG